MVYMSKTFLQVNVRIYKISYGKCDILHVIPAPNKIRKKHLLRESSRCDKLIEIAMERVKKKIQSVPQ